MQKTDNERISDVSNVKTITLEITDDTTNEDIIKALYPDAVFHECDEGDNDDKVRVLHMCSPELIVTTFWKEWLKAPYNKRHDCYRTRPDKIKRNNR